MEGNIYIYIDNSNLWIQGRKTHAALNLHTDDDPTWRFDAGKVKSILLKKCSIQTEQKQKNVHTYLYGSTPPPVDTVWQAFGYQNVKVKTFERNHHSGREKKVDTQLVTDAVNDAADAAIDRVNGEFVIVSGDSDIRTAVLTIADKRKFPVHVWSWSNCLASEYLREPHERVFVHQLDDYLNEISFRSEAWRGSIATIPKHSIVVRDPDTKANEIDEFLESGGYPFRRYTIKSENTHRTSAEPSSDDLVIMHAMASAGAAMPYDAQERFYQECSAGLKKLGVKVMTFLEYEQTYLSRTSASPWKLGISNRFSELPKDEFADSSTSPLAANEDRRVHARTPEQKDPDEFIPVEGTAARRKLLHKTHEIRKQRRCNWRLYCNKAKDCTWGHTDDERLHFRSRGPKKARKINLCNKGDRCMRGATCDFAHGEAEFFCPTCDKTGVHHMTKCPDRG
ncbi:hypothetical protein QBC34DRAFT_413689 [Podospora aff. communis PSN243]|uniref:NYN domain-containing protein n=1 Tax=Podospora aff. communis PSN243 TaxID=3040156 RepID=A0AAV9GDF8_9PEZI|nr:hypothetical protein QBC34DRAFT_413689 [Podospora aff. communis PSN243]